MDKIEQLEIFSLRLRGLRKRKHKKQFEMAKILGCTLGHYQKIEYGKVNIPVCTLITLADYFEVTTDYLLGRSSQGGPVDWN